ncbi:MAG: DUF1080 domain-containing protein [Planctomycetaceae bacterium]|nr:DUF1080 domain-containing protein [Planctomycetaceae bacterium]
MRLSRLALLFALAAPVAVPTVARADDTADFLKPDNWEGLKDIWTVKDGTIVGNTGKDGIKFNTFLCSKEKYTDFELSFQVQLKNGVGNSGIQVRSKVETGEKEKDKFVVGGPQADIGQQYWGSLYGERFGGMMKASEAATVKKVVKPNEFNDYSVRVAGKKVTIKINGETMVDQEFEKLPADGIIAFQAHQGPGMEVTYKNIKFAKIATK